MDLDTFVSRLDGVKHMPSGIAARCPAHHDTVASLAVNAGKRGGIVVKCHAGCTASAIVEALGLGLSDLMGAPFIEDQYIYTDEAGQEIWRVERWANPKTFRCRPGLPAPAERLLYRAEALAWARDNQATVYVVEGEKDANRLAELGLVSTCNVGGADAWLPHYADQLAGCHVIVIADNDAPGRRHAREVAASVAPVAASVLTRVPRYGKDVSDLLDLGWTLEHLDPLAEAEGVGLQIVKASNLDLREIEWAWRGYIPLGAVTIIEADPGVGKSMITIDLVSRWSTGAVMPDECVHGGPYSVVMVSAEDDPNATIGPRLRAAGADMERVELVTAGSNPNEPFTFGTDLEELARHVRQAGVKIIVLDPLMAFLGDKVDSHSDHSVRRALHPLYRLAQDSGAAVIVVRHLNKGSGGRAIYRGGGSIAFIGAARAAYTVGRDPDDRLKRVMACVKMNIAAEPPSLSLSVEYGVRGPFVKWHGKIDTDAQTVLDGRHVSETEEIIKFLNHVVIDEPMKWSEIVEEGKELGYSAKMLRTRRDRSRLAQIPGHAGRASVRWGYLDHRISHVPVPGDVEPICPIGPAEVAGVEGIRADDGTDPALHVPPSPATTDGHMGHMGSEDQADGQMGQTVEPAPSALETPSAPPGCEVCGSELAFVFADHGNVVRCLSHDPETYAGG